MHKEAGTTEKVSDILARLKGSNADSQTYENALINRIAQLASVEGGSVGM
jgi:hypothetical protein